MSLCISVCGGVLYVCMRVCARDGRHMTPSVWTVLQFVRGAEGGVHGQGLEHDAH